MRAKLLPLALLAPLAVVCGCDAGAPSEAVVDNGYTADTVYRAWWKVTLFPDPVAPSSESTAERAIPATDYAYVLLARGYDLDAGGAPTQLLPLMSASMLSISRGDTLHIHVDTTAMIGDCAAGHPLTQDQADFITGSIFPVELAGYSYDAASCTLTPISADDGGTDGD
jgi:hypothetical protein